MKISVVIAAHNAEETIAETLESLCAQTFGAWEAIVVDDGSLDATAEVAQAFAERDSRIQLLRQVHLGVGAARNAGISQSRYEWLLFLDADDWILPTHLERLSAVLAANPLLDGAHCGWARVTLDGTLAGDSYWPEAGDLFAAFARTCAFPIHACIIRRSLVEKAGGFDVMLGVAEEWDLWQRIARTGAQFGMVRESLAHYRMRLGSASRDSARLLADGAVVIRRGHAADPRVSKPLASHAAGVSADNLASALLYLACWAAGLAVAQGEDAVALLGVIADQRDPQLVPATVASILFEAIPLGLCQPFAVWPTLWPAVETNLCRFLVHLEAQTQAPGLFKRTCVALERLVLEQVGTELPLALSTTHGIRIEVTEPLADVLLAAPIERLYCAVTIEGVQIGVVELPVCDGCVPSYVLADAISAQLAWPILGWFFSQTIYRGLRVERTQAGIKLWRGNSAVAENLSAGDLKAERLHDAVGWVIFLQEVWARPAWTQAQFYDSKAVDPAGQQKRVDAGWLVVEASEDPPDLEIEAEYLDVAFMAGGSLVCTATIPVAHGRVPAQALRAALNAASGLELCRVVVREALLGGPATTAPAIRVRLAAAAQQRHLAGDLHITLTTASAANNAEVASTSGVAPGAAWLVEAARTSDTPVWLLARRASGPLGSSVSRRAALPSAALRELKQAAQAAGEMVIQVGRCSPNAARALYAPELLTAWRALPYQVAQPPALLAQISTDSMRAHFEAGFARKPDPWAYTSAYEQAKYAQTLELMPAVHVARALEVGCAEGHFTCKLAAQVGWLAAVDISQIAIERAAQRCAHHKNIQFARLDLRNDALLGKYQLIVCSEVLYYLADTAELGAMARKLANALEPGGYLLTANASLVVDEPDAPGFDWDFPFGAKTIGEVLAQAGPLQLVRELRTPLYRVQLFQQAGDEYVAASAPAAEVHEIELPAPLPPEVAAHVLWQGGTPQRSFYAGGDVSDRLPILMYHRVAPEAAGPLARFCVSLQAFEAQLRYLRDGGYYSVSLGQWQRAMELKRPLPGRPILLTFDDGYLDVFTYAWPLLKRYGFTATIFLVAERVGGVNSWDQSYGETLPLMGWEEVRRLRDEGVAFGAHSATHPAMTSLAIADIVREAARSRMIIERELGMPVTAFAYPYGDTDPVVQHLVGACGYAYGLTCQSRKSRFQDDLLALPRIEVAGTLQFQDFVASLA